ncbi:MULTISPECIES: hypothetical protein [Acidiphilium]|nr:MULTISPECIES: hypothetical protein [Acidiphilium]
MDGLVALGLWGSKVLWFFLSRKNGLVVRGFVVSFGVVRGWIAALRSQ